MDGKPVATHKKDTMNQASVNAEIVGIEGKEFKASLSLSLLIRSRRLTCGLSSTIGIFLRWKNEIDEAFRPSSSPRWNLVSSSGFEKQRLQSLITFTLIRVQGYYAKKDDTMYTTPLDSPCRLTTYSPTTAPVSFTPRILIHS